MLEHRVAGDLIMPARTLHAAAAAKASSPGPGGGGSLAGGSPAKDGMRRRGAVARHSATNSVGGNGCAAPASPAVKGGRSGGGDCSGGPMPPGRLSPLKKGAGGDDGCEDGDDKVRELAGGGGQYVQERAMLHAHHLPSHASCLCAALV